ncbi:polymer-forming cytoskeletal protein [Streptomyces sp. NPDC012474]|uniref:polymer-forming cytoskeletal protein n=1 Tax=Streptomyces sp. NPDC012474 TaxID=3364836 RepID=UPI0036DFF9C2
MSPDPQLETPAPVVPREPDGLADLLPRWHRLRDAEEGEPLRALLAVIAEQIDRVRDGVQQGYEDLFVETAAPWVLPYLGDLVGYRTLPGYERVLTTGLHDGGRAALAEAVAPRRDVAATVAGRRRKGTLHLLEELSEQVANWPARAVELSRQVAHTQPVKLYGTGTHRGERGRLTDLRDGAELALGGGPFANSARTVDVRRAESRHRQGGWTPAGVALFVWRLKAYALTRSPAYCIDRARNLYTFSILGNDTPLVTKPFPEPSPTLPHSRLRSSGGTPTATVDNVPAFVTRRLLHDRLLDYYGPGKSFVIRRDGEDNPVPPSDIVVADLSDWRYRPKRGQVAVDPELGRIAFGSRSAPRQGVWVDYHYAFAADMGGGEYERDREPRPDAAFYRVGPGQPHRQIMDAYRAWQHDRRAGRTGPDGIIEITHSGAYQEQLDFDLDPGDRLELRAAQGTRPVIRLLDWYSNRPDALNIRAVSDDCAPHERPRVVLDGLLVAGRGINVTGAMGAVVVRHSTLVPGWSLEPECDPHSPEEPSIVLDHTTGCLQIEHSILGTIEVMGDEVGEDPLDIHIRDSVLDATADGREALSAPDCRHAHAVLHLHRTTVYGEIRTHAVRIAENSVFTGRLHVARRGIGCLRYSSVPTGSRTPRRHRCADTKPLFTSQRYGTPWYGLLADRGPEEIRRGADDGAEMGAFHDLYRPQREDGLRARLAEYTPAGTDAGIFFVT